MKRREGTTLPSTSLWPLVLAAAALMAPAPAPAQARLRPDMEPRATGNIGQWFGPNTYPPEAIRAAREGRVVAMLAVDATGTVTGCTIQVSSGTTVLDTTTCQIAMAHLHFDPATDHQGHPIAGAYSLPVRWVLPKDTTPPAPIDVTAGPPKDVIMEAEVAYDAGGTILTCRSMVRDAPEHTPDPCINFRIGTPTPLRWMRSGQPVGATIVQHITVHTVIAP